MGDAIFSEDGKQRWLLKREWEPTFNTAPSMLGWVMNNPSFAGKDHDDATVRKCIGFSKRWGFSGIMVANIVPVVSTDPWKLPPWSGLYVDNEPYLNRVLVACAATVVAWGSMPRSLSKTIARQEHILHFLKLADQRPLFCIGLTQNGDPLHPSRAPYTDDMRPFRSPYLD